jgi:hypothetical protein
VASQEEIQCNQLKRRLYGAERKQQLFLPESLHSQQAGL